LAAVLMLIACTEAKHDEFRKHQSAAHSQALRKRQSVAYSQALRKRQSAAYSQALRKRNAAGQDGCIRDTYEHFVRPHVTPVSLVRFCNYVLIKINVSSENTGYHYT
jgi:hypothetical protein